MNHNILEDFSDVMYMIGVLIMDGDDYSSGTDFVQMELPHCHISVDMDADIKGICSVIVDHKDDDLGLRFIDFDYTSMSVEDIIQEIVDFIWENV